MTPSLNRLLAAYGYTKGDLTLAKAFDPGPPNASDLPPVLDPYNAKPWLKLQHAHEAQKGRRKGRPRKGKG